MQCGTMGVQLEISMHSSGRRLRHVLVRMSVYGFIYKKKVTKYFYVMTCPINEILKQKIVDGGNVLGYLSWQQWFEL